MLLGGITQPFCFYSIVTSRSTFVVSYLSNWIEGADDLTLIFSSSDVNNTSGIIRRNDYDDKKEANYIFVTTGAVWI